MDNISDIKSLLAEPKQILITTHRNPDGDAIGSSLGLLHYLNKLGHTTKIVAPSEYPDFLAWLKGAADILIYDNDPAVTEEAVKASDIIFCLDFNSLDRIDKVGDLVRKRDCTKIMIDHHLYPDDFAHFTLSDTSASSTSEMIFDFVEALDDKHLIDKVIGECIFTGILTDTGSFKYSTSPKLFGIVSELLALGVDDYKLQDLIFNSMTEKQLRLLGHCLDNRMEILEEYSTGIITLTKDDYSNFDIQRGDTEGIVNQLLKIKDVKMAAFITEQPTIVKISLRSKGDFSVQQIAQRHFKGGGHRNAAGGASFQGLKATVRKFKELLPNYKSELTN